VVAMTIRPENRDRYPRDWPAISLRLRTERARGRCECDGRCGHDHGGRCNARNHQPHPVTGSIVVLTVAHLDHTPEHCDEENLLAMCQRCHFAYDKTEHAETRRRTKDREVGQGRLWL